MLTFGAGWVIGIVLFLLGFPFTRKRLGFIVAAAVLCFTPHWVRYDWMSGWGTIWPLILTWPEYIARPDVLFFKGLLYMALPCGVVIGIITWALWKIFARHPET